MYKKPVCYNKKGEVLDLDNEIVSRFDRGHAKQARQYVIEFNKGTQYAQHPDVTIPEFLNTPAWNDVSWHNDATGRSEATDTPAGFILGVWVWSSNPLDRECGPDGPRYIVIVEDEAGELLEETEANTDAECLKVIEAMRAKIESLTKETPPPERTRRSGINRFWL